MPCLSNAQEFIFLKKQYTMAYNEHLAERIKQYLESRKIRYVEKKMFGGVCLMVDDKMLIGVMKDQLMARVDPEVDAPKALKRKGAVMMDFTGKTMKGFILVDEDAIDMEEDLEYWIALCLKYNPKAKASKKKAKAEKKA
jgi:TfoX/Sxy family transcriptional regulator of competence genes